MAVSNPGTPDLSKNYAQIQDALRTQGTIKSKDQGKYGVLNAVATPIAEEVQTQRAISEKKGMMVFEKTLEDELNNREFERTLKKEGRRQLDDDEIGELETESGLPAGSLKALKGRFLTADEAEKVLAKAVQAQADEELRLELGKDPKKGTLLSKAAKAAGPGKAGQEIIENEFTKDTAFGAMTPTKDPNSSTGWSYIQRTKSGQILPTGLEAPDPTKLSGRGVSLTPVKREESLRKEFEGRIEKAGLQNKGDALTGAIDALESPSVPNDIRLIYSVAKANDPTGKLSDADVENAGKSGNLPGDLQKQFNFVVTEKKLLKDSARQALANTVFQIYKNADAKITGWEEEFKGLAAQEEGINPKNVVIDYRPKGETAQIVQMLIRNNKAVTPSSIAILKKRLAEKRNAKGK